MSDEGRTKAKTRAARRRTARMLRKLEDLEGVDDAERYLIARSLAATPDERWQLHETFLRSHGLFARSTRQAYGLDGRVKVLPLSRIRASKQAAGRPKDLAHLPLIESILRAKRFAAKSRRRRS